MENNQISRIFIDIFFVHAIALILLFISKGTTPPKGVGFAESGINYIKSEAISYDRRVDKSKFSYINKDIHERYKRSQLQENDILFSIAGIFLGKNAIVEKDMLPANTNQALAILRVDQNFVLPRFISYYLSQVNIIDYINNMSAQSAQPNINFEEIKSIPIAFPEITEQRAIASVLSSLDAKIDLLHRQNATLEAMAEALFKQWFVVGAKEEWEICHLGDILDTVESGSRPKGGIDPNLQIGIASIGAENIDGIGKYDFSKTKFVTQEFYDQMKRGKIRDYDVLVYKDGAYIGKKGMFALGYPFTECAINEHVFILRANKKARQSFLYFILQKDEIEALNSNAAQPGINQDALKSLEIILPPQNEIDKFDTIVLPWINKIFVNALQIRTLEKLRDSLLPKLMSGEMRVKF